MLYQITTVLLIALGTVHVGFTFHEFEEFSLDALWFTSAGIAIILVGLVNIILLRGAGKDRVVRWIGFGSNLTVAFLFTGALVVLREPQVFIGLFLSFVEAALSLRFTKSQSAG